MRPNTDSPESANRTRIEAPRAAPSGAAFIFADSLLTPPADLGPDRTRTEKATVGVVTMDIRWGPRGPAETGTAYVRAYPNLRSQTYPAGNPPETIFPLSTVTLNRK